jgi:GNAT superfamily N-acetyltransferase
VIHPLTPARLNDYLRFFDTRAFTDNANWSRCYCFYPYCDSSAREWNARTYALFPILANDSDLDIEHAGAIVCFVVCPTHRGRGIAKALLDAACDGLQSQGLRSVFAKPVKNATSTAENYPGPLSMFLAAGFTELREDDKGNVIVQKRFA